MHAHPANGGKLKERLLHLLQHCCTRCCILQQVLFVARCNTNATRQIPQNYKTAPKADPLVVVVIQMALQSALVVIVVLYCISFRNAYNTTTQRATYNECNNTCSEYSNGKKLIDIQQSQVV